ncbi:MAG: RNA-binding S4 domain-containing protein [Proteobacteria bacterium]|nr:RNA-binding S4 domain-containing protein [Pseudomonadota bacterium]
MPGIAIHTETIRLSQFLKLANVTQDGAEAKFLILDGVVMVNGEVETRRGRKLRAGDLVEIQGETFEVTEEEKG